MWFWRAATFSWNGDARICGRIGITFVSRLEVRRHFADQGGANKDLVARIVCNHLPELIRLLPEPRRTWQPEQHCMPVFEAASMAIVCRQKA